MTLYHGYDASHPPAKPFPGSQFCCGYLGHTGYTPHVWTAAEWNAASSNGTLRMLPIWLPDRSNTPALEATAAAAAAVALGWTRHIGRALCLDSETSTDAQWIAAFGHALAQDGFTLIDYRSVSALSVNPSGYRTWAADYSLPPAGWTDAQSGFQYRADIPWDGTQVDVSIFDDELFGMLGRGPRK
jgi:hypothetical protein